MQGISISLLLWSSLLVAVVVLLLQKLVEKGKKLDIEQNICCCFFPDFDNHL